MEDVLPKAVPTPVPEDDSLLVARAQKGDERAFSQIYRRHARYVAGVVYRLMGSDQELDDLVQETFVDAANQLGEIRDGERLRPWLARVAVRKVHRRLTRRRRRRLLWSEAPPPPTATNPAAEHEVRELFQALEQIPPKLRVPWVLHRVEGETLPDVAEMCEVSLATVKRRIADAEQRLERRLG